MHQSERITIFCEEIWRWFSLHRRVLPWRDLKVPDPNIRAYRILVSEIMLQQTQVSRVVEMYKKFIRRFPDTKALSEASDSEVIIAWRGMGYNSRALRLRDAARALTPSSLRSDTPLPSGEGSAKRGVRGGGETRRCGSFPRSMQELMRIPGIGHYTAAAIRNFAFNISTPCLDTNIRRIFHRTFVGPENPDGSWKRNDGQLLRLAARVLAVAMRTWHGQGKRGTRGTRRQRGFEAVDASSFSSFSSSSSFSYAAAAADWHAALMDFGSLVCTKTNPKWDQYPVRLRSITKAYGREIKRTKKLNRTEPGRVINGRFVPNRIIRGRIVDHLRDRREGDLLPSIGKIVAPDWNRAVHGAWLRNILGKLKRDRLIVRKGGRYLLPS